MRFVFLLLAFGIFNITFAQVSYNPDKISKKAASLYEQAMQKVNADDYTGAIQDLEAAAKIDQNFMDAYLSIAGLYVELKDYDKATSYYERSRSIDPDYFLEYRLPYSISLAGLGKFEAALHAIDTLIAHPGISSRLSLQAQQRRKSYEFAVSFAQSHTGETYQFELSSLGNAINTAVPEYFPSLTISGDEIVFTRLVNNRQEDFYTSKKIDGAWQTAVPLPGNINTANNEGASVISQDGDWLIFTGCNFSTGLGSCDLYISFKEGNIWSQPFNLGPNVNTEFWESAPSLSPDKRYLYFSSNRPGGFGGSDIYVSIFDGKEFSKAVNLGPVINTPGNESCPFIHADNSTLYFTSNGHLGYGGDDIFLSRRIGQNQWAKPENLGYPINTIENEGSLFITADGVTAYYASDRGKGAGLLDIYTFSLRESMRPSPTSYVKGKVYDSLSHKSVPATVLLYSLETGALLNEYQTDKNGNYLMTLPVGKDYAFNVRQKGYLFYSDHYSLKDAISNQTFEKNIPLQPLQKEATIHLKNIFFETNQYTLLPSSEVELSQLVTLMKENPTLKIEISGHTDNVGNEQSNQVLSEKRAAAVVQYLQSAGIPQERMLFKGYGETMPIADNNTEEGRAMNRRTSVKIMEL